MSGGRGHQLFDRCALLPGGLLHLPQQGTDLVHQVGPLGQGGVVALSQIPHLFPQLGDDLGSGPGGLGRDLHQSRHGGFKGGGQLAAALGHGGRGGLQRLHHSLLTGLRLLAGLLPFVAQCAPQLFQGGGQRLLLLLLGPLAFVLCALLCSLHTGHQLGTALLEAGNRPASCACTACATP